MPRPFERRSETREKMPSSKESGETNNLAQLRKLHKFKGVMTPEQQATKVEDQGNPPSEHETDDTRLSQLRRKHRMENDSASEDVTSYMISDGSNHSQLSHQIVLEKQMRKLQQELQSIAKVDYNDCGTPRLLGGDPGRQEETRQQRQQRQRRERSEMEERHRRESEDFAAGRGSDTYEEMIARHDRESDNLTQQHERENR